MDIIPYNKRYRQDFIDLNTAWITELFGEVEEEDLATFQNMEQEIADGAMVYFALENTKAIAVCMTRPLQDGTWEICKLAADKNCTGKGAGNAVFEACIKYAASHGAKRLFILSNSHLKAALHIYSKHGFQEIKLDDYEYSRGDIAFERILS